MEFYIIKDSLRYNILLQRAKERDIEIFEMRQIEWNKRIANSESMVSVMFSQRCYNNRYRDELYDWERSGRLIDINNIIDI